MRNQVPLSCEGMNAEQPPHAPSRKSKVPGPAHKSASQKVTELKERDIRVQVRSMRRWGDIHQCYDIIVSSIFIIDVRFLIACISRSWR